MPRLWPAYDVVTYRADIAPSAMTGIREGGTPRYVFVVVGGCGAADAVERCENDKPAVFASWYRCQKDGNKDGKFVTHSTSTFKADMKYDISCQSQIL